MSPRSLRAPACAVAFALIACGGDTNDEAKRVVPLLVGRWVQVYPAHGALDTVTFTEDGRLTGSKRGFDDIGTPLTRWRIGSPYTPNALCLLEEPEPNALQEGTCQGFRITGDTLWLANGYLTTFLRVDSTRRTMATVAWASPRGRAVTPAPLDTVHPLAGQ